MHKLECLLTKESDYLTQEFNIICNTIIKEPIRFHRKQWEIVYIIQMIKNKGFLTSNHIGITFGSGIGIDIKAIANQGCKLIVTDLNELEAKELGWVDTNQHSKNIELFKDDRFNNYEYLNNLILDNNVDMNNIPLKYLEGQYDFATSCCALEHLGNLQNGLNFIINSIQCVKIGGIVVHTTEFNLNSLNDNYDGSTMEHKLTSVYRKQDFDWLKAKIITLGHKIYDFDYSTSNGLYDKYIDIPPYHGNDNNAHLRLELSDGLIKFPATCIGIVIERLH